MTTMLALLQHQVLELSRRPRFSFPCFAPSARLPCIAVRGLAGLDLNKCMHSVPMVQCIAACEGVGTERGLSRMWGAVEL